MRRFILLSTCCLIMAACQSQASVKTTNDNGTSTSSIAWQTLQGLLGMNISYPEFFSLEKNLNEFQQEITLTNNRDMLQKIYISAFDTKHLEYCKKEKFPSELSEIYSQLPNMEAIAKALQDANGQETYISDFQFPGMDGSIAFTAYGKALSPCGSLTAPKTNVVLIPQKDLLYVIIYEADVPLLDEIVNKLRIRDRTQGN